MDSFIPSWTAKWTAEKAEKELKGFKFKGPGWYYQGGDTLLVIPTDIVYTREGDTEGEPIYRFCVYNHDPYLLFKWIIDAPIQIDERELDRQHVTR